MVKKKSRKNRRKLVGIVVLGGVAWLSSFVAADTEKRRWRDPTPPKHSLAPFVLYTDVASGPIEGGEGGLGMYVTIFGKNFGESGERGATKVFIGGVEVTRYIGGVRRARGREDIEAISVQVGALGKPKPGQKLAIKVVAHGMVSNEDQTFTVQPGRIFYLDNLNGDDNEGVVGDIAKPFRYVQTGSCSDMRGVLTPKNIRPGDVLVLRGRVDRRGRPLPWSDLGCDRRFARFRSMTGTPATGDVGAGPITIIGYPGEDVLLQPPKVTPKKVEGQWFIPEGQRVFGGIHGMNGQPDFSDWVTIANLRIEGGDWTAGDGPINLQSQSDHWRIINNELFDWAAADKTDYFAIDEKGAAKQLEARSGAISGNGRDVKIYGNHIHHIYGTQHNHCIYLDSYAEDIEIAYNHVHDCTGGNIIQTYDNIGMPNGASHLTNITVHHNLLHDGQRYGLNVADNTRSFAAWNNIIFNTAMAGIRFNVKEAEGQYSVVFNTLYNVKTAARGSYRDAIEDAWSLAISRELEIKNNIVWSGAEAREYFGLNRDGFKGAWPPAGMKIERNLWYGVPKAFARDDTKPLSGAPAFMGPARGDFRLDARGAGAEGAVAPVAVMVNTDYALHSRRASGAVGALEVER